MNDPETQRQKQYGAGSQNTKHKTKDWPTLTALRRVWRYQRGNQNPYVEEEQTTQWPKIKVQNDKQRSTKHKYKTKDRVTRIPLKTGGELMCSGRVSSSCSTSDTRHVVVKQHEHHLKWCFNLILLNSNDKSWCIECIKRNSFISLLIWLLHFVIAYNFFYTKCWYKTINVIYSYCIVMQTI